jgi:membrane protein DedA with SNARE-associated domain
MLESFANWVQSIVRDVGYPGLFVLITLESTLVPIPSELVMPFAGYMASKGELSLPLVLVINSVAACVGSGLCYWIGAAGGKPLLEKYGKYVLIRQKDIAKTEAWFARHGRSTIFVGRFLPVVRHIISMPAGLARMPLVPFFTQTLLGATIWGSFLILLGYELGAADWESVAHRIKSIDLVIGALIIVVFLALAIRFVIRRRRESTTRAEVQNPSD